MKMKCGLKAIIGILVCFSLLLSGCTKEVKPEKDDTTGNPGQNQETVATATVTPEPTLSPTPTVSPVLPGMNDVIEMLNSKTSESLTFTPEEKENIIKDAKEQYDCSVVFEEDGTITLSQRDDSGKEYKVVVFTDGTRTAFDSTEGQIFTNGFRKWSDCDGLKELPEPPFSIQEGNQSEVSIQVTFENVTPFEAMQYGLKLLGTGIELRSNSILNVEGSEMIYLDGNMEDGRLLQYIYLPADENNPEYCVLSIAAPEIVVEVIQ